MQVLISIIAILLMILVHEWGHFIAGRICKVPVYEFSIGFGPKIFQKQGKKETIYSVRAIPLGGYCAFDKDDATGTMDTNLNKQPLLNRMFIFIAGPFMNILTTVVVLFFLCFAIGNPTPVTIVDSTYEGFAAHEVLQEGDELISANGIELNRDTVLLSQIISESKTEPITFEVLRNGETFTTEITPQLNEENGKYAIGIIQKQLNVRLGFIDSVKASAITTYGYGVAIFDTLGGLFTGKYSVNQMSSIVGIVDVMSEYATASNLPLYISLCAYISFNLGLMNLLPIPGLDGSKILFGIIEGITRKRVPEKFEAYLTLACMALLLLLSGYLILNDVWKIFQ